jgi:hypothetical protein
MRTDVTIDTKKKLRIPGIPPVSIRPCTVGRGDFIEFKCEGNVDRLGRIIGVVRNPDDGKEYFCVVMFMMGGDMWERWVLPEKVHDTRRGDDYMCLFADKAKWFHSKDFLKTPVDQQRQISGLLCESLITEGDKPFRIIIADGVDWIQCEDGPWESIDKARAFADAEIGKPWVVMKGDEPVLVGSIWTK